MYPSSLTMVSKPGLRCRSSFGVGKRNEIRSSDEGFLFFPNPNPNPRKWIEGDGQKGGSYLGPGHPVTTAGCRLDTVREVKPSRRATRSRRWRRSPPRAQAKRAPPQCQSRAPRAAPAARVCRRGPSPAPTSPSRACLRRCLRAFDRGYACEKSGRRKRKKDAGGAAGARFNRPMTSPPPATTVTEPTKL
jgi:hypothetical protein